MLEPMLWILFAGWVLWCLGNLALMFWIHPDMPHVTGFRISIPPRYINQLLPEEFLAIYLHEVGHRHHLHIWENYARVCFFGCTSRERRARQEHEADDYAAALGLGPFLVSAIRKLSTHPDDLARAERLELRYQALLKGSQDASDLNERDARAV